MKQEILKFFRPAEYSTNPESKHSSICPSFQVWKDFATIAESLSIVKVKNYLIFSLILFENKLELVDTNLITLFINSILTTLVGLIRQHT